jgi:hypothetical protein
VATIALGVAVDDTIHFMVRYQRFLRETGDQRAALSAAVFAEGRPIMITSLALICGFLVLVASPFNPTMHFGVLASLIMVYAILADLFVNPLLLMMVQLITVWDYVALRIKRGVLERSPIFRGMSKAEVKTFVLLGSTQRAAAGDLLVRQGEEGSDMYVLLEGTAKVSMVNARGEEIPVSTLEEGSIFGEMALLGDHHRTASVSAGTRAYLLRIDDHGLARAVRRNPRIGVKIFRNLSTILSGRLRSQTRKML